MAYLLQTWKAGDTFEPGNPFQLSRPNYSPVDMGYVNQYWNAQPTTASLKGALGNIDPTSSSDLFWVLMLAGAGFAGGYYFRHKHLPLFGGAKRRRRSR